MAASPLRMYPLAFNKQFFVLWKLSPFASKNRQFTIFLNQVSEIPSSTDFPSILEENVVAQLFSDLGFADAKERAKNVMQISEMLNFQSEYSPTPRQPSHFDTESLGIEWPNLHLQVYTNYLKLGNVQFGISSKQYFDHLNTLLAHVPVTTWMHYFQWFVAFQVSSSMPWRALLTQQFQMEHVPRSLLCVNAVQEWMWPRVHQYFAYNVQDSAAMEITKDILQELVRSFVEIVLDSPHLDSNTKKKFIQKILSVCVSRE